MPEPDTGTWGAGQKPWTLYRRTPQKDNMNRSIVVFKNGVPDLTPLQLADPAPVDIEEAGTLVKHKNVKVECTHLACVEGPNGTRHHVLFDPTPQTLRAIREWEQSGYARGIDVEDRAGLHSRDAPAVVLKVVSSYGTTVVTTSR